MGRATRWFKGLLGMKKEKEQHRENSNAGDNKQHQKDKKRWSFGKSGRESSGDGGHQQIPSSTPANMPEAEAAWLRSFYTESENQQNKHAIAVAAATAAAADAAVAAAQAAVAVVRLTSHGRGTMFGGGRERWAAVRIQTVFRGFLSRKALRALKGLVKLQAVVRGYLVRKQANATLHSMQALIRAQATVRSQKTRNLPTKDHRFQPRKSIERFDDSRSEYSSSIHSRRISTSMETSMNNFDESPKIVEIDTYRPKSRSRRTTNAPSMSDLSEDTPHYQTLSSSSPFPPQVPARLSIPECRRNYHDSEWGFLGDECKFSTAQSTPRFMNSGLGSNAPVTPSKSVCAESYFRQYSNFPNYMANTQSFRAKVRSYSAPRQRPEPAPKKQMSLKEMVESRCSLSGVRMQKSCSKVQENLNLKNSIVVGKIDDGSAETESEIARETDRDYYFQRRW